MTAQERLEIMYGVFTWDPMKNKYIRVDKEEFSTRAQAVQHAQELCIQRAEEQGGEVKRVKDLSGNTAFTADDGITVFFTGVFFTGTTRGKEEHHGIR